MILQMNLEILSRQYRGFTTMWACNWESTAFRVMSTERIENEFFVTITARDQPLCALAQFVLTEMSPLHLHPALVLTVQRLVPASTRMFLQHIRTVQWDLLVH